MSTVSVIIAAYNAREFLLEAINSAVAQSAPPLEVLVVDDGSTDDTAEIVAALPPPVKLVSQSNQGCGSARNHGWSVAKGEWVAFLDADDIWDPRKLELQLEAVRAGANWVYTARRHVGEFEGPALQTDIEELYDGDVFEQLLICGNFITVSSAMLRRTLLEQTGGFSTEHVMRVCEDWELWTRISANHHVAVRREPLVNYRLHALNISRQSDRMARARTVITERALASPRGRALPWQTRRRAWAYLNSANGWDARRHRRWAIAAKCYLRSAVAWPLYGRAYSGLARVALLRD